MFEYNGINTTLAGEADLLSGELIRRAEELRAAERGSRFALGGFKWQLVANGDNVIYRVRRASEWFAKLPHARKTAVHEMMGAQCVAHSLAQDDSYQHPEIVRISSDHAFSLYPRIRGINPYRVLHLGCLRSAAGWQRTVTRSFHNLGSALAKIHCFGIQSPIETMRDSHQLLRRDLHAIEAALKKSPQAALVERISKWSDRDLSEPAAAIHGNIKSQDIFVRDARVCLIDFESFGLGNPSEDLAGICSHILLLRTLPVFPWKRARSAMTALLGGYYGIREICPATLLDHVTVRVIRYFVTNGLLRPGRPSLAGMPVRMRKLEKMIDLLLSGQFHEALAGVELPFEIPKGTC